MWPRMNIKISTVAELGQILRAARKAHGTRLDDLAAMAGVGATFASQLERGKETVQLGLVLKLLDETGLRLIVDMPEAVFHELQKRKAKSVAGKAANKVAKTPAGIAKNPLLT
jgi:transcriptional regulator with XRE-family HTH domain